MKWSLIGAATLFMLTPIAAESQSTDDWKGKKITLSGCVAEGAKKGHYLMTHVTEVAPPGGTTMPAYAHGRRVIFWLEDVPDLKNHANHMIHVRGDYKDIKESETDPKTRNGATIVELEGPGRDVTLTAGQTAREIGPTGPTKMKTFLITIDVEEVKAVAGATCPK